MKGKPRIPVPVILVALLFFLFFQIDSVLASDKIIYGDESDFPPFSFINSKGEPEGFNLDLIKAIAKEQGMEMEFLLGEWPEIRKKFVVTNEVSLSNLFFTPARDSSFLFSNAFATISHEIVCRKGGMAIKHLEELEGKKVMLKKGAVILELLKNSHLEIDIIEVNDEVTALRNLAAGQYDAVIVTQHQAHLFIEKYKLTNLTTSNAMVFPLSLSFATKTEDTVLIDEINAGLMKLRRSGRYAKIYVKWFGTGKTDMWSLYAKWATICVLGALILFGLVLFSLRKSLARKERQLQKELEQKNDIKLRLQRKNEELTGQTKTLNNFVYRSSHELLKPIDSIKELMLEAGKMNKTKDYDAFALMIDNSLGQLEDFVGRTMDYAYNVTQQPIMESISLSTLLDRIVEELPVDKVDKLNLVHDFENGFDFRSDFYRLKIILNNLIVNCIDHHDYRKSKLEVRVHAKKEKESIHLQVKDNGAGIDARYLPNVFDMFYRASEQAKGAGLGLYIVKDTVLRLGGEIRVTSTVLSGTVFFICLPSGTF